MIHLGILLIAGGIAGAAWREYKHRQHLKTSPKLSVPDKAPETKPAANSKPEPALFDDMTELDHYQRVSWYALAFSASGTWFYPPVTLISIPLLGYNAYHYIRTIRQGDKADQRSALTVFEMVAIGGTLVTGRPTMASVALLLSFGTRNLLLRAGNITSSIVSEQPLNLRHASVWTLRDGVEVETPIKQLQTGDIVVLHAGDTVAIEGRVLEGAGLVRQFSLRKKMKIIPKQVGDKVFPFTRLESGNLYVRAN